MIRALIDDWTATLSRALGGALNGRLQTLRNWFAPPKEEIPLSPPDISRVMRLFDPDWQPPSALTAQQDQIEVWKRRDFKRLDSAWHDVKQFGTQSDSYDAFLKTIHDVHGASELYGGEVLLRLTATLQRLLNIMIDITPMHSLIELHLQACHAAAFPREQDTDAIRQEVCNLLEAEVARAAQG